MGNTKSEVLEKKYNNTNYQIVDTFRDQHLGFYAVLKFSTGKENLYCFQRFFNPNLYQESWDTRQLISNISITNKYLADFYFRTQNQKNPQLVDLIFEYGPTVKSPLKKEKYIWILLNQILEPLMLLEGQQRHYPIISIEYVLQVNYKEFKLVNPYCFPQYFEDHVRIYLNPEMRVSEKQKFFVNKRQQNIHQIGCLALSLVENFDNRRLIDDFQYRKNCLKQIENRISKNLKQFFTFVFGESGNRPMDLQSLKHYLNNNSIKINKSIFGGIFHNKILKNNSTPFFKNQPRQYNIFDQKKISPQKIQEPPLVNKKKLPLHNLSQFYEDDIKVNQESYDSIPIENNFDHFQMPKRLHQTTFNQESLKKLNETRNKSQTDPFIQNDYNLQNSNQNSEIKNNQQFSTLQEETFRKSNSYQQFTTVQTKEDLSKVQSYQDLPENQFKSSQILNEVEEQDRESLAQKFSQLIQIHEGDQEYNTNRTSHTEGEYNDQYNEFYDDNSDQEVPEYVQKQEQLHQVIQEEIQEQSQEEIKQESQENNLQVYEEEYFKASEGEEEEIYYPDDDQNEGFKIPLMEIPQMFKQDKTQQNSVKNALFKQEEKEPYNPLKEVVQNTFRYSNESQQFEKFAQYKDGTTEQIPITEEEQQRMSLLIKKDEQTPKKNAVKDHLQMSNEKQDSANISNEIPPFDEPPSMDLKFNNFMNNFLHNETLNITEDISVTLMHEENNLTFVINPGKDQIQRIQFRKKILKSDDNLYKDLQGIVDQRNKLRPSQYHQVDDIDYVIEETQQENQEYDNQVEHRMMGTLRQQAPTIGSKKLQQIIFKDEQKLLDINEKKRKRHKQIEKCRILSGKR